MKILCTIYWRWIKGLTNKALRNINKKPLIYTIREVQTLQSKIFNEVVVSTDSKKIQTVSKNFGAKSWFLKDQKIYQVTIVQNY